MTTAYTAGCHGGTCRHGPPNTVIYTCGNPGTADCAQYAAARAWRVVAGHNDNRPGLSLGERPGWQAVETALATGEAEIVVVPHPDHLAASDGEFTAMQSGHRDRGTVLVAVTGAPAPQRP